MIVGLFRLPALPHGHYISKLSNTVSAHPKKQQQGVGPVLLLSDPQIWVTHTHVIRVRFTVLPRQHVGLSPPIVGGHERPVGSALLLSNPQSCLTGACLQTIGSALVCFPDRKQRLLSHALQLVKVRAISPTLVGRALSSAAGGNRWQGRAPFLSTTWQTRWGRVNFLAFLGNSQQFQALLEFLTRTHRLWPYCYMIFSLYLCPNSPLHWGQRNFPQSKNHLIINYFHLQRKTHSPNKVTFTGIKDKDSNIFYAETIWLTTAAVHTSSCLPGDVDRGYRKKIYTLPNSNGRLCWVSRFYQ